MNIPKPAIFIVSALLFLALMPMPYGYYILLRWICTALFAAMAFVSYERNYKTLVWVYSLMALLFNPVIPLNFGRDGWAVIDIGTAIFLLISSSWFKELELSADDPEDTSSSGDYDQEGPGPEGDDKSNTDQNEQTSKQHIKDVWHVILGVPRSASKEDISAAYKRLISQYHPDKVSRMGPEIREIAERKTKEINAAYAFAMSLFH